MLRYVARWRCCQPKYLGICTLLSLLIIAHVFLRGDPSTRSSNVPLVPLLSTVSDSSRTHDFRHYPGCRSADEYRQLQLDSPAQSMFSQSTSDQHGNADYSKALDYSESQFRLASVPIIWLDAHGDVRWNRPAQNELLSDLLVKQFPSTDPSDCLSRQLFVLEQWPMGFFSRHHCLIEHFGQTLYSPSLVLLAPKRFGVSHSSREDFRSEGILRYYQSISLCSAYLDHPKLKPLHDAISTIAHASVNTKIITNVRQLLERDEATVKYKYSREIWKFGYDHVPHRRWLFDRNRASIRDRVQYNSTIPVLIDHSNEHIYHSNDPALNVSAWTPRNAPQGPPKDVLEGQSIGFTAALYI